MVGRINTSIASRSINGKTNINLLVLIFPAKHWRLEDNKSDGTKTDKYGSTAIYKYGINNKQQFKTRTVKYP